jgi:hypothetical protein
MALLLKKLWCGGRAKDADIRLSFADGYIDVHKNIITRAYIYFECMFKCNKTLKRKRDSETTDTGELVFSPRIGNQVRVGDRTLTIVTMPFSVISGEIISKYMYGFKVSDVITDNMRPVSLAKAIIINDMLIPSIDNTTGFGFTRRLNNGITESIIRHENITNVLLALKLICERNIPEFDGIIKEIIECRLGEILYVCVELVFGPLPERDIKIANCDMGYRFKNILMSVLRENGGDTIFF